LSAPRIAGSLFAATAVLLGAPAGPSLAQDAERPWQVDASAAYYGETARVKDGSFNALVKHPFSFGSLSLRLGVDTLTGPSASGAAPARVPQTFTSPSGKSQYGVGAGATPLDPSFHDTRFALALGLAKPVGERSDLEAGLSFSAEYDYLHLGADVHASRAFNERNTTISIGAAVGRDSVKPVGGAPIPFAPLLPEHETGNKRKDESKTILDLLAGVVQVLGPRTIVELNYSFSRSSGYLTDPYKLLSVVDPVTGELVPGQGLPGLYLFESRPDERTKQSGFLELKQRAGSSVLDVTYRYLTDDWGIRSHTAEVRVRVPVATDWSLQPHVRWYTQTAADFYRPYLTAGTPLPDHASADYRLGALDAWTFGAKVGYALGEGREVSLRIELYRQAGRSPPGAAFGALSGLDLAPPLRALIVQSEYRF
jgi:hypothetical protein